MNNEERFEAALNAEDGNMLKDIEETADALEWAADTLREAARLIEEGKTKQAIELLAQAESSVHCAGGPWTELIEE